MAKIIPFNKPSNEVILAAVNELNLSSLTSFEVSLSAPAATPAGSASDTSVTLIANDGGGYYGNVPFYYNRVDLSKMSAANKALLVNGPVYDHDEVVGLFNEAAGTGLVSSELSSTALDSTGTLTFTALGGYLFKPGTKVKVRDEFDDWVDRAWLFSNYTVVDSTR